MEYEEVIGSLLFIVVVGGLITGNVWLGFGLFVLILVFGIIYGIIRSPQGSEKRNSYDMEDEGYYDSNGDDAERDVPF